MRAKGPPHILLRDADKDIDTEGAPYDEGNDRIPFFAPSGFNPMTATSTVPSIFESTSDHLSNYPPTTPNNNNHHAGVIAQQQLPWFETRSQSNQQSQIIQNNLLRGYEPHSESPPPLPQLLFESGLSTSSSLMTDSLVGSMFSFSENERSVISDSIGYSEDAGLTDQRHMADLNCNTDFDHSEGLRYDSNSSHLSNQRHSSHNCTANTTTTASNTSSLHNSLTSEHQKGHHTHANRRHSSSTSHSRCSRRSLRQNKPCSSSKCLRSSSASLPSGSLFSEIKLEGPEDIAEFIATLRKERSKLLQEIEQEDEVRSAFYAHLDSLNQRLRSLPQQYNVGCERWRVEGEICRVQEALSERLGTPPVMLRRRDQRLHSINAIEKAIQRLRQDSVKLNIQLQQSNDSSDSVRNLEWGSSCEPSGKDPPNDKSQSYQDLTMDVINANNQVKEADPSTIINGQTPLPSTSYHPTLNEISHHGGLGGPSDLLEESFHGAHNEGGEESKLHPTIEAVLRGTWPFEKALWHSSPASVGAACQNGAQESAPGIMSTSSVTSRRAQSQQQLLTNKVEMVYGLLSMFSSGDRDNMSRTLLAMSSSPDSCVAMRQSGCLPLLIQLLHGGDDSSPTRETRLRAAQALHNVVYSHPDDKRGRREARVLRLLEQLRDYSDSLWDKLERLCAGRGPLLEDSMEQHPGPAMAALMKLSFDEEHRHAMCALGGLHAIAELIKRDHEAHGSATSDQHCTTLRRYAGMALTNLTFGDGTNKALLCSLKSFMRALVSQLHSPSEDLRQVTASVLRNLSWRADSASKASLREVGGVTALTQAALNAKKESTLKVILSAIWNLSAHCSMNKADICNVEGALAFICSTLTYKSQSKTLSIIENGGGILRNISSHIAIRDELRQVLRDHYALTILLAQLRSPSLTVVSNACGTLWNLSARCPQDQATLWKEGAVPMLRSLINSKHKMISMGSSAALKNLLHAKPEGVSFCDGRNGLGLPSLQARKQKALEQELDPSLSETCDNIETSPRASPTTIQPEPLYHSMGPHYDSMRLSDSRDSVITTHSDSTHDRMQQLLLRNNRNGHQNGSHEYLNGNIDSNLSAKVANLGNKYCNGISQSKGSTSDSMQHDKPTPKVNNFIKSHRSESRSSDSDNINAFSDEDQPTNFSLRYTDVQEDTVGDLGKSRRGSKPIHGHNQPTRNGFFDDSSVHDDSLRTFCTEGTPYNFSTATSLSDLRDSALQEVEDHSSHRNDKRKISLHSHEEELNLDLENFDDSDIEISVIDKTLQSGSGGKFLNARRGQSKGSSGDNPITYCVEGTPVSISRISSVSSISSADIEERIEKELLEDDDETEPLSNGEIELSQIEDDDDDNKSITNEHPSGPDDHPHPNDGHLLQVCNETPLMFSRTTSVSSLSSFDIQSIHDDRSSVVSDFSRVASGIISPSDLPDSPSQTIPSSPKRNRCPSQQYKGNQTTPGGILGYSHLVGPQQSTGIFRDAPRSFMDEGTPAGFSHGTSLSSLTFDDDDIPPRSRGDGKDSSTVTTGSNNSLSLQQQGHIPPRPSRDPVRSANPKSHGQGLDGGSHEGHASRTSSEGPPLRHEKPCTRTPSEGPPLVISKTKEMAKSAAQGAGEELFSVEADERRLAALIKSGMPSSKKLPKSPLGPPGAPPRTTNRQVMPPAPPPPPPPPVPSLGGLSSAIPIKTANLQVTVEAINLSALPQQPRQILPPGTWSGSDGLHNYRTEGTPVSRSQAGSVSDLSVLSMPSERSRTHTTDSNDSEESVDGKKLLEKCIRSGKPKTSQRTQDTSKERTLLSPRRLPNQRPVPVARVLPAVKVGVVSPQIPHLRSPASYSSEELKTWAVEGTPAEFSPSASLNDLTSDPHLSSSIPKRYTSSGRSFQRPEGSGVANGIVTPENDEIPRRFAVEDTPSLSRHSSLSSIGMEGDDKGRTEEVKYFGVENTPVLFSHNSSLSSLSIESDDTTPREEALLRHCINQGMPKGGSSRIPGAANIRNIPQRIIPGVPLQRLRLSQADGMSNTALNCDVESKKLHTESEESEKQATAQKILKKTESPHTSEASASCATTRYLNRSLESSPEQKIFSADENKTFEKESIKSPPSWESKEEQSEASFSESNAMLAEALKVAKAVSNDVGAHALNSSDDMSLMSVSVASASSVFLDQIKAPSAMGSLLSLSTCSIEDGKTFKHPAPVHKRMECRHTKKVPEMVRRALGEQELPHTEGGSLASSCHSNLDNIFPPSLVEMEDDMESSMISVASIQSEVVEPRDSPPSAGISLASEAMNDIIGPANQIVSMLQKEANFGMSTVTLIAGEETSTCQEITDFDETLAAQPPDGNASDTEVAFDDLPHDIPDLPQDSPLRSRSGTPSAKSSPRLTPKTQRSQLTDRYRTFTRDSSSPESIRGTPESPRSPAIQRNAKHRRAEDSDRFKTRTISCELPQGAEEEPSPCTTVNQAVGKIVPVQNNFNNNNNNNFTNFQENRKSFKQKRIENPDRYQTRTIEVPVNCFESVTKEPECEHEDIMEFNDGDDLALTQAQMEVLSQDANIVICSLNENREAMTTSANGDFFSEENILDIETLSLISNEDAEEVMNLLSEDTPMDDFIRKPRIVKPGEVVTRPSQEEELPSGKGIRGRRKPLYSSGRHVGQVPCSTKSQLSMQPAKYNVTYSSVNTRPILIKPNTSPKQQPRATRASTLRQNNLSKSSSNEDNSRPVSSSGSSAGSSPKLSGGSARSSMNSGRGSKFKEPPLKRQNTFTKDDELQAAAVAPERPARKNSNQTTKGILRNRPRKDAMPQTMNSFGIGKSITKSGSQEWNPSLCKNMSTPKSQSLTRDAQPPSIKEMAEWNNESQPKSAAKTIKKDVTSRIASLWKKVEKAQGTKEPTKKDDRIWIGGAPKVGECSATPIRPLVRSSTFEKESNGRSGVKMSLGLKLSRLKGRDTRSSPSSEVSTPVDLRPQCLVSPTRVTPRPRPATHPSVTPRAAHSGGDTIREEINEKRLSRLGSFIVVDEDEPQRGRAVVAPFNYRSQTDTSQRASSMTRIPQPSKPIQNNPRDDNGNSAVIN